MTDDIGAGISADTTTPVADAATPPAGGVSVPGDQSAAPPPAEGGEATRGTIAGGNATDRPVAAPADWPEDWRVKLAGEDKSYLKTLDRFNSPADLAKAYRDAQARLSSGQLKAALPDNPSAEELAAWRTQNGVPESPDKYDVNLGDGFVWGDADKPLLDDFTKYAHEANLPADQVKKVLGWYADLQERSAAAREEADERIHMQTEDALRQEWGQEYRRNVTAIGNVLNVHASDEVQRDFLNSRMPDGTKIGDHPGVVKFLASLAREANPTYTITPNNGFSSAEDELTDLQRNKMPAMIANRTWHSSPEAKRYGELLEAKEASEKRGGRAA